VDVADELAAMKMNVPWSDHDRRVDDHCIQPALHSLLDLSLREVLRDAVPDVEPIPVELVRFPREAAVLRESHRGDRAGVDELLHAELEAQLYDGSGSPDVHIVHLLPLLPPV
jgi:hypothetical protein